MIQWTDLPYGKLLVPALIESPKPAFCFSTIEKRKTTCMKRRKPASINVRTDLSLNYLYDIKYSFLRKLSLQVFSVISIRYVQMVSSSSEGFQCYNLQYFCFASSICCSIAFSHLAHKTASQQLFYRGLPWALTLLFPLLYCGHMLQGQK